MASTTTSDTTSTKQTLSLGALSALVVGTMVGAGIFTLPASFGRATGVLGALIAWTMYLCFWGLKGPAFTHVMLRSDRM